MQFHQIFVRYSLELPKWQDKIIQYLGHSVPWNKFTTYSATQELHNIMGYADPGIILHNIMGR